MNLLPKDVLVEILKHVSLEEAWRFTSTCKNYHRLRTNVLLLSHGLFEVEVKVLEGRNVLMHGPGGTGKSYNVRKLARLLDSLDFEFACTATTGVAALNIGVPELDIPSYTVHSWGLGGLAQKPANVLLREIRDHDRKWKYRSRWKKVKILVIDEVSMLGRSFFKKLDYIAKHIREDMRPFGGIQLVLTGDFLQLPPVKDEWVFTCKQWKDLELYNVNLNLPKRYDDEKYFQLLQRVRYGEANKDDIRTIRARKHAYKKLMEIIRVAEADGVALAVKPTLLLPLRRSVEACNKRELEKLNTPLVTYKAKDKYVAQDGGLLVVTEGIKKVLEQGIPEEIVLRVGAQVMLKRNISIEKRLVNGSRGVVVEAGVEFVRVRFLSGITEYIEPMVWEHLEGTKTAYRKQIPLVCAWASTIHRGQGATLDYAVCDLGGGIFETGQAYVALSRVRNLKGLFVKDFDKNSLFVNPVALEYVKSQGL